MTTLPPTATDLSVILIALAALGLFIVWAQLSIELRTVKNYLRKKKLIGEYETYKDETRRDTW